MNPLSIYSLDDLEDRSPAHALVANVDLVVTRFDDEVSVLYGRCAHRGALMSDGHIDGDNLMPFLKGEEKVGPRKSFLYWTDDGEVAALRYNNWKSLS